MNIATMLKNTKIGPGKTWETLASYKKLVPILLFPINFFLTFFKNLMNDLIGTRLKNAKFGQWIINHFSRKGTEILKHLKNLLLILEFPINPFENLARAQIKFCKWLNIGIKLENLNLIDEHKTVFLGKSGRS